MITDNAPHDAQRAAQSTPQLPPADGLFGASTSIWKSAAGGARAGGDWCEVVTISDELLALTIGDVSGHGAGVAETMAAMRTSVLHAIRDIRVPSEVLAAINAAAYRHGGGVIVTAIVAFLNQRLNTLTFANAGHPPPLLLRSGRHAFLAYPPADLPLGIARRHHAADYVIALPDDALLALYTDGVTEHDRDPVCGERDLLEAVRWAYDRSESDLADAIARRTFRSMRGTDDAAVLVLRTTA
jgi:serine phosphatase RsbU (regulator of sigma subunit)